MKTTDRRKKAHQRGTLDGLYYALEMLGCRRLLKRTPDYLAAINEMEILLLAAIDRVENGESPYSTSKTQ